MFSVKALQTNHVTKGMQTQPNQLPQCHKKKSVVQNWSKLPVRCLDKKHLQWHIPFFLTTAIRKVPPFRMGHSHPFLSQKSKVWERPFCYLLRWFFLFKHFTATVTQHQAYCFCCLPLGSLEQWMSASQRVFNLQEQLDRGMLILACFTYEWHNITREPQWMDSRQADLNQVITFNCIALKLSALKKSAIGIGS